MESCYSDRRYGDTSSESGTDYSHELATSLLPVDDGDDTISSDVHRSEAAEVTDTCCGGAAGEAEGVTGGAADGGDTFREVTSCATHCGGTESGDVCGDDVVSSTDGRSVCAAGVTGGSAEGDGGAFTIVSASRRHEGDRGVIVGGHHVVHRQLCRCSAGDCYRYVTVGIGEGDGDGVISSSDDVTSGADSTDGDEISGDRDVCSTYESHNFSAH